MCKRSHFITIGFIMAWASFWGQDELGIAGSQRAPVNTAYFNPASICDARTFVDVEFAGVGVFLYNNLAFVGKKDFSLTDFGGIGNIQYNLERKRYAAKLNASIKGPSFTATYKEHSFGMHTGVNVMFDLRRLPNVAGPLISGGLDNPSEIGQQHTISNARAGLLAYGYVGLSYATIAYRWDTGILLAGATINRILSPGAFGVHLNEWTYTLQDSSKLTTQRLQGDLGFNSFGNGLISGKGWGIDLGVTYKKRMKGSFGYTPWSPCTDGKYKYKISAALLDFGSAKFKSPYFRYEFNQDNQSSYDGTINTNWDESASVDSTISQGWGATAITSGAKLKMKLPTALSAQVDYHVIKKLYALGALTWGFPRKNNYGIQRASYIAVVPRWESQNYEASIPISLYDFKKPMVGLCFRVRSFIIGSDNLNAFLFNGNLSSANVYIHLKFSLFNHPKCKVKGGGSNDFTKRKTRPVRQAPRSPVPCPRF
jgi:Family of unknown function (DUF5723)